MCLNFHLTGTSQNFFNGQKSAHKCKCSETQSCLKARDGTEVSCNCDAKMLDWNKDDGIITAMDILPISGIFYGPLLSDSEHAYFTIGKFKCKGTFPIKCCICILVFKLNFGLLIR